MPHERESSLRPILIAAFAGVSCNVAAIIGFWTIFVSTPGDDLAAFGRVYGGGLAILYLGTLAAGQVAGWASRRDWSSAAVFLASPFVWVLLAHVFAPIDPIPLGHPLGCAYFGLCGFGGIGVAAASYAVARQLRSKRAW